MIQVQDDGDWGEVIGHYSTRGGRYQIQVFQGAADFSYKTFNGGHGDGGGYGYSSREQVAESVARMIYNAARIDGINYRAIVEMPEVTACFRPQPQEA